MSSSLEFSSSFISNSANKAYTFITPLATPCVLYRVPFETRSGYAYYMHAYSGIPLSSRRILKPDQINIYVVHETLSDVVSVFKIGGREQVMKGRTTNFYLIKNSHTIIMQEVSYQRHVEAAHDHLQ